MRKIRFERNMRISAGIIMSKRKKGFIEQNKTSNVNSIRRRIKTNITIG